MNPAPAPHKRQQVADSLRKMLHGLKAGDRLPSVHDLEKHFGVAKSTVEAAVSELQAEGLIVRRKGSGTFVADAPRGAGRRQVGRIMITSIPLGTSLNIYSAMLSALESEMRRLGYEPVLFSEVSPALRFAQAQQRWEAGAVDGFINIGSLHEGDLATYPTVPGVVMGEVPDGAPVHQVVVDNYGGGRAAGQYLWGLGHRRIAFMAAANLAPAVKRRQGLVDAVVDCGGRESDVVPITITWRALGQNNFPVIETALKTALEGPEPVTAFFFGNDQVAFPALQTLLAWGIRIPGDVSVLSFDDTPGLASQTRPALTSLRMPTLGLGALAVQTLHQANQEPGMPFRRLVLPAELIVRESSGPREGSGSA